ncbi:DUF2294 domain-containing protein [Aneurinibacillus aneurinilyticus]|jgi:uncharacterized protein YbcI|uniref:DUF2294 family protein n=2 Tax=Aneurinibacillus aneurinilyticus TaxID=1391 RepID=A0A848CY93_ANEAE|nr:Na-translocating system protein MpsC family protein [Aneurinibacillus aneurinilyticus]ERI08720.1 hypothetical protein HMPREF0083_03194 [Aneurinibacillus aneurinilyticus ATCC 12856]MCI1696174.1 Na-translocating system protein MpsC family protein [Aneurinibacillus aneurinilyticus]MED0672634.1 Na-translocating system protein MpsC family protein [Aneurinibacillus aneurinilyticus]MED0708223.1 Na-translocating system protein MpsC family protein [Aneurinibacillus aneurinilyticus]MED0726287.1 Na-tr
MEKSNYARIAHEFSNLVREIRKTHVGKGPTHIITRFVGPWAICEMKGNLTSVEKFMSRTQEGQRMIHATRTEFIKKIYEDLSVGRPLEELVNARMVTLFVDFRFELDIAMTVFVFDRPLGLDSE